ncbi:MAG TPA: hypothetical protein VLV50_14350 [Stellaceae bacterium]|nr:hypothetical protein [Stellaceae bacterium]
MRRRSWAAFLLGIWVTGLPLAARAIDQGVQGPENQWKQTDKCGAAAFKKYPDYTPEANAKREAYRRECLRSLHIAAPDTPLPPVSGAGQ